jgi:putative endonuclease
MAYFVYILRSRVDSSYYIGFTQNLPGRLRKHNEAKTGYTMRKKPWELIYFEQFETKELALKREKSIKRMKSRLYIAALIAGK